MMLSLWRTYDCGGMLLARQNEVKGNYCRIMQFILFVVCSGRPKWPHMKGNLVKKNKIKQDKYKDAGLGGSQ